MPFSDPRVLLLHWNRGKWNAKDHPEQALTENACETWVFAFGGDFLNTSLAKPSDLKNYDIIIANSDSIHIKKLAWLSSLKPSSSKWITLVERDASDFIKPRPFVRELFDNSDLINCINPHTTSFFRTFTTARVEFIGFPYPAENIRAYASAIPARRKEILLAPLLLASWLEYFCINDLGIPFYGYEKRFSRTLKTFAKKFWQYRTTDPNYFHKKVHSAYRDESLRILRQHPLNDFFRISGGSWMWLSLDPRYTWGRYVLDAAALGVPIVTTRSTGHAEFFFPELVLENEFELDKARELIIRLFRDQDFYRSVSAIPLEKFDHLRPEVKKKELLEALS